MARTFVAASSQQLSNTALTVPARPVTFACWYRPTSLVTTSVMGFFDGTVNEMRRMRLLNTGELVAQDFGSATDGSATTAAIVSTGVWHHLLCVFTSATSRTAILDGGTPATNTTSVTPVGLDEFWISGNPPGGGMADGDIAEAAIWTEALSVSDASFLARGYAPTFVKPGSLRHYWGLDTGASPEPDRGLSASASLTLVNGPAFSAHPPFIIYPNRQGVRGGRRSRRVA